MEATLAGWPFADTARPSKVVAIGRNYASHARELGNEVPEDPFFFLKPPSSLLPTGAPIVLPAGIGAVHHEIELGVILGTRLRRANPAQAPGAIAGWCLALDLTARDLQTAAKQAGRPWTMAKGYDGFCPVSELLPPTEVDPREAHLELVVNGAVRQDGHTRDMVWKVPELMAYVSNIMTLEPGDLLLTGTPAGVGPLEPGDQVVGRLDGVERLQHVVMASAERDA